MAQYDVNWSAPVALVAGTILAGQCVVPDTTGAYNVGTAANRALYGRCDGLAVTSGDSRTPIAFITTGPIENAFTGLGAGLASWVRVSTLGVLERITTPGAGDDVVGWCEANGRLHAHFGFITASMANGTGSGGTVPTGTGIPHIVGGAQNAAATLIVDADVSGAAAIAASKVVQATGTGIPHVVAGALAAASSLIVDADVTSVGVGKLTGLGANVATFLSTPSGANLGAALTSALTVAKGGTGLTALTIPASGLLVGTTDLQTLTNKSLTTPTVSSTVINNATSGTTINNCTLSGSAGTVIRLRFTDAIGPTVTGFDVTTVSGGAVTDGTILRVTAVGGTVAFNHENAGSTAANRITCGGLTINLPAGSHVDFEYDGTSSRWRAGAGTGI